MVPVEHISAYLEGFKGSPLQPLLKEILYDNTNNSNFEVTQNASELALNLIIAVKKNTRAEAEANYAQFSKRQPSKDSHWIYDNYVIFCIICAVRKFGLESQWIRNVLDLSYSSSNAIEKTIKDSFKNILSGNYSAQGNFHQISLVYQFVAKDKHFNEELIDQMFRELWLKEFPYYEEDFLNVISLKAIEIGFSTKKILTKQEYYLLYNFVPTYCRRSQKIAKILAWIFVLFLCIGIFYILWKLNLNEQKFPLLNKLMFFLLGISGVGVLGTLAWRNKISKIIHSWIDRIWGYKVNDNQ